MVDLGDLMPKAADIAKAKVGGFVHSTLAKLAKDLGAPPEILRQIRSNEERYDVSAFMADFPKFPWDIVVDRVDSYNVQQLFETPTKSPVFARFKEHFKDWENNPRGQLMFFKAQGFTTLVAGTANAFDDCATFLTVTIRGYRLYVTTYADFVEACGDRRPCAED